MKNKFFLLSFLILVSSLITSCKQPGNSAGSEPEEVVVYTGTVSSMTLMQKTEYVFNKGHPAYYDKIINYGNSYDAEESFEVFDYSDFNFETKTGKYVSKVFDDAEGKTVLEESVVTIEKVAATAGTSEYYAKSAEYFKYSNGAKEEKAYMIEYSEALDVDFALKTMYKVYSPKDNDSVMTFTRTGYDEDKLPLFEVDFYSDMKSMKSLKVYKNDGIFKRCESVLSMIFEEDPVNNPDVYCTMEFFEYEDDTCSDYILRRFYSAVMLGGKDKKGGYNKLFPDGTIKSFDENAALGEDDFDDLPSSYEGRKYSKYNGKEYPVTISTMNEDWEVENQIKKSYAKIPDSSDYYESESITLSKKSAQGENVIALKEDTRTKRTYAKNKEGVLSVCELIYGDKDKYGSSKTKTDTGSGSKDFNN